jgi:hypothetical protein
MTNSGDRLGQMMIQFIGQSRSASEGIEALYHNMEKMHIFDGQVGEGIARRLFGMSPERHSRLEKEKARRSGASRQLEEETQAYQIRLPRWANVGRSQATTYDSDVQAALQICSSQSKSYENDPGIDFPRLKRDSRAIP